MMEDDFFVGNIGEIRKHIENEMCEALIMSMLPEDQKGIWTRLFAALVEEGVSISSVFRAMCKVAAEKQEG
jgi:hypothetical protein